MKNQKMKMDRSAIEERYALASWRIGQIPSEETSPQPYRDFFSHMAGYLQFLLDLREKLSRGETEQFSLNDWKDCSRRLYEDILPERYPKSWASPRRACGVFGQEMGQLLGMLAAELYELPGTVFETVPPVKGAACSGEKDSSGETAAEALEILVIWLELFIEIYNRFETEKDPEGSGLPEPEEIRRILYWFYSDYCDVLISARVWDGIDPERDFAVSIVMGSDLEDLRCLYRYGEYISENELETARFLNAQSEETITLMAKTIVEGYRTGFVKGGKDLSKKRTVSLRYHIGFERVVRRAVSLFEEMGLAPVISRRALQRSAKNGVVRNGYEGAAANPQFDYDHKEDQAIFLDAAYVQRKLDVIRWAYEQKKDLANAHAGPAVIEVFGEAPFNPEECAESLTLSDAQQALSVRLRNESMQLTNEYIIGEEISFTIIAFPSPMIGPRFEEIFRDTMTVNTLDSMLYETTQQKLIDVLDRGRAVRVRGRCGNRTDITVALSPLADPSKETNFENCVADVNIPVGEVFTSPKLEGTNGVLHVTRVYLEGLNYQDLCLTFRDGMITDYSCGGFDSEEEGRAYLKDTVLFHHDTLPLGEFAVGTNTSAYAMAQRYGIGDKLPILIAEKCGPHFAVGDTCYCWTEDIPVFNPDGKEIIARDNSVSALRRTDPGKAYFGCHTDITIPYSELGEVTVLLPDGDEVCLLKDGRFVLPGTELLNRPLDELDAE